MKIFIPLILLVTLYSANLFSQAKDKEERKKRFSSDSEFSLLAVSGNSNNTALNLLTKNRWPIKINNIITFGGHYTYATDEETLDTKNWDINLRYERKVSKKLGFYLGTIYEVDTFAGYDSRDNVDVGVSYEVIATKDTELGFEAGYRWMYEKDVEAVIQNDSKFRIYSKWEENITKNVGLVLWVEYLPNFTRSDDWMFNMEPSIWVDVSEVFGFKFAYKWRYRGLPPVDRETTDITTTSSLLVRF